MTGAAASPEIPDPGVPAADLARGDSATVSPRLHEITEPPVDVPVSMDTGPDYGGRLEVAGKDLAYIADMPLPQAVARAYRVAVCRCASTGKNS